MNFLKYANAVFAFLLFSSITYSQWFQQNSGTSTQLNSIYFINPNTGIIASDSGKVLRTTNGGINWATSIIISSVVSYKSVYFYDQNTGYIAGRILIIDSNTVDAEPKIIKTTNGGVNWFSTLNDSGITLRAIYFINPNTGFATGGLFSLAQNYLLTTTNAGLNWQRTSPGDGYLYNITFKDAFTGYMTAVSGNLFKTTNLGMNWSLYSVIPSIDILTSISFIDANLGFMTGGKSMGLDSSGNIYKSTNGGNNWSLVYNDHKGYLNAVKFVSSNIGYAVGTLDNIVPYIIPGRIIRTTNSGNGWFIDTMFTSISGLTSLYFTDLLTGYVVGSNGVILKTTTGGNLLGIEPISLEVPNKYSLSQNYPNPFNPSTTIKFDIPKESNVKVSVFDILGNEVQSLIDENVKAGEYKVTWDGTNYASGIYFYKLQAGEFTQTRKMLLIK